MKSTPKSAAPNSIPGVRFSTLGVGVASARLQGEGLHQCVVGMWKSERDYWYGPEGRNLAEEFADWPGDAQSILDFTRRYGPVEERGRTVHKDHHQGDFWFTLEEWRKAQREIHRLWEAFSRIRPGITYRKRIKLMREPQMLIAVVPGETMRRVASGIEYQTKSLWRFLLFSLCALPAERLKKCARPDCPNRCFIAHHLGQRYCSDVCAQWGQKLWKREWWKEHGKKWLEGRKRQKRKNGKKKKSRKGR